MPFIDSTTKYEFVKFKDGKEVFAMVREISPLETLKYEKLELHFPMNIQLSPAPTGGIVVHLGPYIPFTHEDCITVESDSILFRTSISKKFISFYDEACTTWLNVRDNDEIDIKSSKQAFEEHREAMIKRNFEEGDIDFRDELNQMIEEIDQDQELLPADQGRGPGPNDTIH